MTDVALTARERLNPRVYILAFGTFATGTNALIMSGILPDVARALRTTQATAGLGVTAFALAYAIAAPFLPALLSRYSRRSIMLTSLTVFTIGTIGSLLATQVSVFLIARVVVGVGAAAFTPQASATAIAMVSTQNRGRALTTVALGVPLATATGVPLGTLLGNAFGYRAAFGVVAVLGSIAFVAILIGIPKTDPARLISIRHQLQPFTRPPVILTAVTTCLITAGFYAVSIYVAPLLASTAGIDAAGIALVLSVFGVASIVSLIVGGRAIDRFGGRAVVTGALVVVIAGTVTLGIAPTLVAVVLVVVPWGIFGNITVPALQYEMARLQTGDPAPGFALNSSAVFLGTAIGGVVGADVIAADAIRLLTIAAALPMLVALLLSAATLISQRRSRSSLKA